MKDNRRNRLILVGNGFDIAAGLKTSYSSFILALAKKSAISSYERQTNASDLFTITIESNYRNSNEFPKFVNDKSSLESLLDFFEEWDCQINYKHEFIQYIIEKCIEVNWVEIEKAYYKHLLDAFDDVLKVEFKKRNYASIVQLNNSMEILSKGLEEYIREEQKNLDINKTSKLSSLIHSIANPTHKDVIIEKTLAVNFNYSNAFERISNHELTVGTLKHLHIHGTVNDVNHPIIFGYGDDTDQNYEKLEREDENEILSKIKSFQYPLANSYSYLLDFIDSVMPFDVIILGHGCGLSDKTMLETIFGHKNCISIEAYHYMGAEEFFDKSISISRHFKDKRKFRETLLEFELTGEFPK